MADFEIEEDDPYDYTAAWGGGGTQTKKSGFFAEASGEEDPYNYDLGNAVQKRKSKAKSPQYKYASSPSGSEGPTPAKSRGKEGGKASKKKAAAADMTAMERAQSMLDKYSSKPKQATRPPFSRGVVQTDFDEDNISLDNSDNSESVVFAEDSFDDDAVAVTAKAGKSGSTSRPSLSTAANKGHSEALGNIQSFADLHNDNVSEQSFELEDSGGSGLGLDAGPTLFVEDEGGSSMDKGQPSLRRQGGMSRSGGLSKASSSPRLPLGGAFAKAALSEEHEVLTSSKRSTGVELEDSEYVDADPSSLYEQSFEAEGLANLTSSNAGSIAYEGSASQVESDVDVSQEHVHSSPALKGATKSTLGSSGVKEKEKVLRFEDLGEIMMADEVVRGDETGSRYNDMDNNNDTHKVSVMDPAGGPAEALGNSGPLSASGHSVASVASYASAVESVLSESGVGIVELAPDERVLSHAASASLHQASSTATSGSNSRAVTEDGKMPSSASRKSPAAHTEPSAPAPDTQNPPVAHLVAPPSMPGVPPNPPQYPGPAPLGYYQYPPQMYGYPPMHTHMQVPGAAQYMNTGQPPVVPAPVMTASSRTHDLKTVEALSQELAAVKEEANRANRALAHLIMKIPALAEGGSGVGGSSGSRIFRQSTSPKAFGERLSTGSGGMRSRSGSAVDYPDDDFEDEYSQDFENDRDNGSVTGSVRTESSAPGGAASPVVVTETVSPLATGPSVFFAPRSTASGGRRARQTSSSSSGGVAAGGGIPSREMAEMTATDLKARLGGDFNFKDPLAGTLLASQELFRKQLSILRARVGLINRPRAPLDDADMNTENPLAYAGGSASTYKPVPSLAELKAQFMARRAQNAALSTAQVSLSTALRELDPNLTVAQANILANRYNP